MRPRIIDLYCGEGGAGAGYFNAGFDVVGADERRYARYPFPQIVCDVPTMDPRFLATFDAVHASPPCQGMTEMNNDKSRHLNLIPATRKLLVASGRRYVIENVRGAAKHLVNPVSLFGTMFDQHVIIAGQRFDLSRERCFETNWGLAQPWNPGSNNPIINVFGGHLRSRSGHYRTGNGTGRTMDFIGEDKPALARALMEMPWATMRGISEAVPPPYTQFIGEQLMGEIRDSPYLTERPGPAGGQGQETMGADV